jgi:hypothetical protein
LPLFPPTGGERGWGEYLKDKSKKLKQSKNPAQAGVKGIAQGIRT